MRKATRMCRTTCALSVVLLTLGTLSLAGCGSRIDEEGGLSGKVEIDGSSTVYPISEAMAASFRKSNPSVDVTVGQSGTGGGFKRFTKGETDISNASRPITADEFKQCKENKVNFIELPIAYDGLSFVVHKDNAYVDELTVDQLKTIFLADKAAKTWKEVNDAWPAREIKIYAPGTDSGTFDYAKEVLAGKDKNIRPDMSTNEDDGVLVTGVAGNKNAIGFFGCSYYFANKDKLKVVKIINPTTKQAVEPTHATIESGEYAPFSRPLFIYVKEASLRQPQVKKFVEFYLNNAAKTSEKVGYVALPAKIYDLAQAQCKERLAGTCYLKEDGTKRGGSLAEVYKKDNLTKVK
jgi:phosphate transport system substrate-binding protein